MPSLCNTNVEAFTKTNVCLTTLGCALTENMLRNPGNPANYFYEKKPDFSSCPGAKVRHQGPLGTARAKPCDHYEKKYKIKNIKETSVHFALMGKNGFKTSFICRVTFFKKNSNFYSFLA